MNDCVEQIRAGVGELRCFDFDNVRKGMVSVQDRGYVRPLKYNTAVYMKAYQTKTSV